jgi:ubiquinone biosynthesis protein COQ9
MTESTAHSADEALCRAALALAAERGWDRLTYGEIVEASGLGFARARAVGATTLSIFHRVFLRLDEQAGDFLGALDRQGSVRDRLFEVLMARLDVMQEERPGFAAFADAILSDFSARGAFLAAAARSAEWMLALADGDGPLVLRPAQIAWLTGAQYRMLSVWRADTGQDLAETMRVLDETLREAESWAERFGMKGAS